MHKSTTQQVLSTLIIIYLLGFLVFLVYSGIRVFSDKEILQPFFFNYIFQSSLYLFITYLIPLTSTGIVLAFSLRVKLPAVSSQTKKNLSFHQMITSILVAVVVLSVLYTFVYINLTPTLIKQLDDYVFLSKTATQYMNEGNKAYDSKDYPKAIKFYTLYLNFNKDEQIIRSKKTDAEFRMLKLDQETVKPEKEEKKTPPPAAQGYDVRTLISKTHEYIQKKDYVSAYYFSKQALVLDKKNIEAQTLAGEIWHKLISYEPSLTEQKIFDLYADKLQAYQLFTNGQFIEAYYSFSELKEKYPYDTEIEQFKEESRIKVQDIAFFFDEIEETIPVPGARNILFVQSPAEGIKNLIFIKKMVTTNIDIFFHDIEFFVLDQNRKSYSYRFYPYGKFINDYINVNCIPGQRNVDPGSAVNAQLTLKIDARYLPGFSLDKEGIKRLNLMELIQLNTLYGEFGHRQEELTMSILFTILNPCLFFILALLSIALGWAYRTRYLDNPPAVTLLLIPAVPLFLFLLLAMIEYVHKILFCFFIITAGFIPALICLIVMEVILLFITLFILACQKV